MGLEGANSSGVPDSLRTVEAVVSDERADVVDDHTGLAVCANQAQTSGSIVSNGNDVRSASKLQRSPLAAIRQVKPPLAPDHLVEGF